MKRLAVFLALIVLSAISVPSTADSAGSPAYLNTELSFHERAVDLVSRMTLEEKVSQMSSDAASISRLGVPAYHWGNEALHGVLANGFTVFPQSIGLGASWDTDLLHSIGTAISDEARANCNESIREGKGPVRLNFWSPNINIARDPRWGRNQETYGEDPYLTARLAVNYVKGLQGNDARYIKTVSTPKHFAVHSGPEPLRHGFDARVSKREMWDTYLPAFEAAVREGGAYSVMGAYSAINGVPCCANEMLLTDILRKKWGFKGYVVSDCGAIEDIWNDHHYEKTPEAAAADAVKAGCDLACVASSYTTLPRAISQGLISEKEIDTAVTRLMEARMRLGMFDPPEMVPYSKIQPDVIRCRKHLDLSLQAARESIVLLKNANNMLPLSKKPGTVAVIGPSADVIQIGDYSGTPRNPVSILQGIREKLGSDATVLYARGCELAYGNWVPVPSSALTPAGESGDKRGLLGEYFIGEKLSGKPALVRTDEKVDFDWGNDSPAPELPNDQFSIRWTGKLTAPVTGKYTLGTRADDGVRLYLDGKLIVDNWVVTPAVNRSASVELEAGKSYDIEIEYFEEGGDAVAGLYWSVPGEESAMAKEAEDCARKSDLVLMVLGTPSRSETRGADAEIIEDEGVDRKDVALSPSQEELLETIAKTGKPMVLILTGGSPISVPWAEEHVSAIVETWFAGEFGGRAVADVLFGDYNPAGRLPMTCYTGLEQVPDFKDYSMQDRTYRYFSGTPLYPFGFGLSYTKFGYSGLKLSSKVVKAGDNLTVTAFVRNTGRTAGDEVVQLYLTDLQASSPVPIRKLIGFKRISLRPNEKKQVSFTVTPDLMSLVDNNGSRVLEPGSFRLTLGGSQGDARSLALGAAPVLTSRFEVLSR